MLSPTSIEVNLLPWKLPWKLICFHGLRPLKQNLLPCVPPTSTEISPLPCKLPPIPMEVDLLQFTSHLSSFIQELYIIARKLTSMYVYFDGIFHQLLWKLEIGQLPWKQLQLRVVVRVRVRVKFGPVEAAGSS